MTDRECTFLIPPDKSPVVSTTRLKGMMVYRPITPWSNDNTVEMIRVPYAQLEAGCFTHLVYEHRRVHSTIQDSILYSVTLTWDTANREPILAAQFFAVRGEKGESFRGLDLASMSTCTGLFEDDVRLFRRRRGPIFPSLPRMGFVL